MVSSGQDIRQPFNNQKDLEAVKDLLKETEEMLRFGTWNMDIATGDLQWSDGKYSLLGLDKASIAPKLNYAFFLTLITDKDRDGFAEAAANAIKNKTAFEYTYSLNTQRQEEIVVYSKGKIVFDDQGNPAQFRGVTKDVTETRDHEIVMEEKLRELDRSNKDLEEFAYIASHDLQEPLRKITSFSERLKEKLGPAVGQENQFYLTRMLSATDNMRLLIDNLLEFSRTSRYSQPFEMLNLNEALADVQSDLELKIEETNTTIHSGSLPSLNAIPSQIRQLFTNLLTNAIKFKKADTPPIISIDSHALSREEKEHYRLRLNKIYYLICVKDNGIGFEQEFSTKIFQIFQRLNGKSEYPGSGIGLAICKKIAENHAGVIFANGELGSGAEFVIILPETQI